MSRTLPIVAVVSMLIIATLAYAAPSMHQGKVTGVGKADVMIMGMSDAEMKTFLVNDQTKITVDAKPAKLVDVQLGFVAEITAEMNSDGKWVAKMITASSKKSP